ncbi:MAG: tetratricopeptide repeat protein, partial [Chloroflexota bacterium]|nr:tetratricopeptide repeat protein [Chloroflexota bacterium]
MSEVGLKEYRARARELLDTEARDQAIAICQHILSHYPRDVMTYQLLGEICLDKRDYSQAIDFFQRVLSADPENFIARVGLSICFDEGGSLDEAIWQLERAFELNPGSVEVRNELRRLYSQRDGAELARIKLNSGALGRLYAKGEFFQLAATEFRGLLEQDPQLVDVQVALAETLWRDRRLTEAARLCVEILEKLPNCLKANLILASIWMESERTEEGKAKLELARSLDPTGTLAQELLGERSPLTAVEAILPALDEKALAAISREPTPSAEEVPEEVEEEEEVEWLRELEVQPQEAAPPAEEAEVPDWLLSLRTGAMEAGETEAEEMEEEGEGIPAWLEELRQEQPPAEAEEERAAEPVEEVAAVMVEREMPGDEPGPSRESEEEGIPDWLSGLGEEEVEEVVEDTPPLAGPPVAEPAEEIPAWLQQLKPQEVQEEGEQEITEEAEEVPDWLRGLREELPAEEESEREEAPSWLQELAGAPTKEVPPQAEEAVPAIAFEEPLVEELAAEPAEEIPDWLQQLKPEDMAEGEEEAEGVFAEAPPPEPAVTAEEVPEAMGGGEVTAEEEEVAEGPVDEIPGLVVEQLPAEMTFEQLVAEVAPELADQVPAWFEGAGGEEEKKQEELPVAEAEPSTLVEEIPDWLRETAPELEVTEAESPAPPAEEELPEWLRGLEVEEEVVKEEVIAAEAPTPAAEEELPEWLREPETEEVEEIAVAEAPPVEVIVEEVPPTEAPVAGTEIETEFIEEVEEEVPEWLHSLRRETGEKVPGVEPAEEIPEWLQELRPALPEEMPVAEEESSAQALPEVVEEAERPEEVPHWLRELRDTTTGVEEEEGVPAEAMIAPSAEAGEEIPDWLRGLKPVVLDDELAEEAVTVPPEEIESVPEWLRQAGAAQEASPPVTDEPPSVEAVAEEGEAEAVGRVPAWLQELEAVEEVLPAEPEVGIAMAELGPALGEEEAPAWLRELEAEVERLPPELFAPIAEEEEEKAALFEEAPAPAESLVEAEAEEVAAKAEPLEEFPPELL